MAWIKTVPLSEADEPLLKLLQAQRELYPPEYAEPVPAVDGTPENPLPGIVASHSLIPEALDQTYAKLRPLFDRFSE